MPNNVTIVLEDLRELNARFPGQDFKVQSLTNTVEYHIGQVLPKDTVESLCRITWMTVKIVKYKPAR